MAIQVQIRRGTTSENNAFIGASGEITCDTEAHTLRIHDGTTAGGFIVDQSANVVHKTGNQSEEITGTKTFTANPYITKNDPAIITNNRYVTLPNPTNYDTTAYSSVIFNDKNGKELGYCRHRYHTQNNINYSSMELIAIDPDTTHYNNRIISTNNITYVSAGDDNTNRVRKWKKENTTTPIYYTPYTGTTAEPIKQPAVGTNIYSDIACQTAIDTIAQIGSTRINSTLTLEAKGGTERYAYLNFNPPANSSTSSTHLATVGWCNDYQLSTNLVHRDSTETITGDKTFSGNNTFSKPIIATKMKNPNSKSYVECYESSADNNVTLYAESKNGNHSGYIGIYASNMWGISTSAPHSWFSGNGSIVTNYSSSREQNGYFKLGNGLILQWGWCDTRFSTSRTITFPTAFSSTNYVVSAIPFIVADLAVYQLGYSNKTTTTVNINSSGAANDYEFAWLAIGY